MKKPCLIIVLFLHGLQLVATQGHQLGVQRSLSDQHHHALHLNPASNWAVKHLTRVLHLNPSCWVAGSAAPVGAAGGSGGENNSKKTSSSDNVDVGRAAAATPAGVITNAAAETAAAGAEGAAAAGGGTAAGAGAGTAALPAATSGTTTAVPGSPRQHWKSSLRHLSARKGDQYAVTPARTAEAAAAEQAVVEISAIAEQRIGTSDNNPDHMCPVAAAAVAIAGPTIVGQIKHSNDVAQALRLSLGGAQLLRFSDTTATTAPLPLPSPSAVPSELQICPRLTLEFEDLTLLAPGRRGSMTNLVNKVTGRFGHGMLHAVMGPSGSGKTSLLLALSGRVPASRIKGQVRVLKMDDGMGAGRGAGGRVSGIGGVGLWDGCEKTCCERCRLRHHAAAGAEGTAAAVAPGAEVAAAAKREAAAVVAAAAGKIDAAAVAAVEAAGAETEAAAVAAAGGRGDADTLPQDQQQEKEFQARKQRESRPGELQQQDHSMDLGMASLGQQSREVAGWREGREAARSCWEVPGEAAGGSEGSCWEAEGVCHECSVQEVQHLMGYVPQEDLLHESLTVSKD